MPRPGMSTAILAAFAAGELRPVFFVQVQFISGTVYLWTGLQPITWNGQTWSAVGMAGTISAIETGHDVEARGITLTLSGLDTSLLPDVQSEIQLGLPAMVYVGALNGSTLIASPVLAFGGRVDQPMSTIDGAKADLAINCESRLVDMNVAIDRRYTNDDQQRDWPGDLGLSFVPGVQEMTLYWGSAPTSTANI